MPSLFGHDIANKTATLIGLLRNIDLQVVFNNVPKKKKKKKGWWRNKILYYLKEKRIITLLVIDLSLRKCAVHLCGKHVFHAHSNIRFQLS